MTCQLQSCDVPVDCSKCGLDVFTYIQLSQHCHNTVTHNVAELRSTFRSEVVGGLNPSHVHGHASQVLMSVSATTLGHRRHREVVSTPHMCLPVCVLPCDRDVL